MLLTDKDWNNSRTNGDVRISFEDYRKLQRDFRDKVLLALSLLGSNLDVIKGLQMYNTQLREQDLIPNDATFIESSQLLEHQNLKIVGMRKNLESVVRIVEGTVKLVNTISSFLPQILTMPIFRCKHFSIFGMTQPFEIIAMQCRAYFRLQGAVDRKHL